MNTCGKCGAETNNVLTFFFSKGKTYRLCHFCTKAAEQFDESDLDLFMGKKWYEWIEEEELRSIIFTRMKKSKKMRGNLDQYCLECGQGWPDNIVNQYHPICPICKKKSKCKTALQ